MAKKQSQSMPYSLRIPEKLVATDNSNIFAFHIFCGDSQAKRRLEFNKEAPTDPLAKQQKTH
jgi:hypothetical protein